MERYVIRRKERKNKLPVVESTSLQRATLFQSKASEDGRVKHEGANDR